jgi:hypothetical protein
MKIFEVLTPVKKSTLLEAGTAHVEDWTSEIDGGKRALAALADLQSNPSELSIKWDGSVGIVFGRDANGKIVFVDHYQFDKVSKGKAEFSTIRAYDEPRGVQRDELWKAEDTFRPLLDRIVPKKPDQYWFGDLMWVGEPDVKNGKYVFQPRTVRYSVDKDSTLGQEIGRSNGGIAVHTFFPSLASESIPLRGLQGLREGNGIVFFTGEMKDVPTITIDKKTLAAATKLVEKNTPAVNSFIESLAGMKSKTVLTLMSKFISQMIDENDVSSRIVPRFMEYLQVQLSAAAAKKLLGEKQDGWLYQEGAKGLAALWEMWATITDLKLHVKQQVDKQVKNSTVHAEINGDPGHEGYVFGGGDVKLVDRLGFTRALRAKFTVPQDEIVRKSQMPKAVFCFGRMNPPTIGHKLLMQKTVETGGDKSFIFLSGTADKVENPLDPQTKADFIKKIYPEYAGHIVSGAFKTPIDAANHLYELGYRNITFVGGSDRLGSGPKSMEKLLNSWNSGLIRTADFARGPKGREHVVLNFVSSGERDPDSKGVEGISGSKAREAAAAGDEKHFFQLTGVSPKIKVKGQTLYQATRNGLGLE